MARPKGKKNKKPMMVRMEKIIDDMLENIDSMSNEDLIKKRDTCKVAIDFMALKKKVTESEKEGSFFKGGQREEDV